MQSDCDINVIYDEHGRTWVSSGGYLSLYNAETKTFEQHFSTEKNGHFTILGILYCNDNIWIGETKGLREYNTKTRKTTDYTNGLGYSGLCSPFEKTLTGDILLGTYDSGIFIFNPLTGRKIHLLHRNNIHKISFVTLGDRKQVWVATDKGLWIAALPEDIFQLSDASFTNYMPELMNTYAISSHVINTIFQDENGVIWLGTEAGINKLNPAYLRFQDVCIQNKKNKGLQARYDPQRAFIVKGDQGKIDYWFAFWNYGGLIKTDTNFEVQKQLQFKHESLPYPAIANVGNVFKGKDSNLWISTWDGLWSYDDKHDKLLNNYKLNSTDASQPEKSLFNFATHDKGGDIWIGTYNQGLYVLNPESNIWKVFKADSSEAGPRSNRCHYLYADSKNRIWLSDFSYFDRNRGKFVKLTGVEKVYKIIEDKTGNIWFASEAGIIECNGTGDLTFYDISKGLGSSIVNAVELDDNGNIWAATYKGLSCLIKKTGRIITYTTSDGLPENKMGYLLQLLPNGKMLINYESERGGGFLIFSPEQLLSQRAATPFHFTSISIFGKPLNFSRSPDSLSQVHLDYNGNSITVGFKALTYTGNINIRYRYKLKKNEKSWIDLGKENSITFSNLAPGEYDLSIQATDGYGNWLPKTLSLTLIIDPPFYMQWWFIVVTIITIGLVGLFFVRKYINSIRAKADVKQKLATLEMKALKAQINPHFIFNSLSSIQESIVHGRSEAASKYLGKFSKLIRMVLTQSEAKTISLSTEVEYLNLYI